MDSLNLELLALTSAIKRQGKDIKPPPRHRPGEKFLKGPIPWNWIIVAARLPGKALHVAIAIWFLAGLNRNGTIKLSASVLREIGVKRNAYYLGLEHLERAGLVSVTRHRGRKPVVTIIEEEKAFRYKDDRKADFLIHD